MVSMLLLVLLCGQIVECQIARPIGGPATSRRLVEADQDLAEASLNVRLQSPFEPAVYKCAKYCSCSVVQVPDWADDANDEAQLYRDSKQPRQMVNLSQVKCESSQFSDLLTIDRRTQIIHISLPKEAQQQQATRSSESQSPAPASAAANPKAPKRNQLSLMSKLFNLSSAPQQTATQLESRATQIASSGGSTTSGQNQFRMPRLAQFVMLREIILVNLRIEVCNSEVFKRGQRLMRLKWNGNSLKQVSKSCFRHLDTLLDLNLDHNQLEELESALFSHLVGLRHLSLAHNQLTDLAAHQFANLGQLISLNLVGNSFKSINLNLLEPMQNSLQLLALANNQIRSFVLNQSAQAITIASQSPPSQQSQQPQQAAQAPLSGAIFRNLIKLNVDFNQFERIKLLQLHRFFNVKFLSIRGNNIATIRDKAFNGLKLVELNLAQNKLQSISRCAFCNSTIKRLNLAENNISAPNLASLAHPALTAHPLVAVDPLALGGAEAALQQAAPPLVLSSPASSASMLVLGQSIFGPLFNHLEYLDLSHNLHLANQLELLLEPLLELQYLNLAAIGLDRSLPTPSLFKNLRRLTYLNLSNNHLDQLVTETIEPLKELQLLDLSHNDLSELDESFLVTLDELPMMRLADFGSNPWYCSQCKISSLYEWILRSPIYNATCLSKQQRQANPDEPGPERPASDELANELDEESEPSLGFIYKQQARSSSGAGVASRSRANTYNNQLASDLTPAIIDFELILDLFQDDSSLSDLIDGASTSARSGSGSGSGNSVPNYQFDDSISLQQEFRARKRQLSSRLLRSLASPEDDNSIARTIESVHAIGEAFNALNAADMAEGEAGGGEARSVEPILKRFFPKRDFCLKCEFPSELRSFYLHELIPTDFRYCAGSAPRTGASEPKVGLTLAIVIISVLVVVIIVVIVMYRKKSNTYYTGDDLLESAESGQPNQFGRKNQPVLSVSSDMEQQYGDATDYSSPPMSQTYSNEDSFTGSEEAADEGEPEDEDEEQDEFDEDEEEDEEENDEEENDEEEEELDEGDEEGGSDDGDKDGGGNAHGGREHAHFRDIDDGDHESRKAEHKPPQPQPPPSSAGPRGQNSLDNVSSLPPSSSSKQEDQHSTATSMANARNSARTKRESSFDRSPSPAPERTRAGNGTDSSERPKSRSQQKHQAPSDQVSQQPARQAKRRATKRGKSQATPGFESEAITRNQPGSFTNQDQERPPSRQSSHFDRDDSTPIFITRHETSANLSNVAMTNNHLARVLATSSTPASLSAADLLNGSPLSSANITTEGATVADSATPTNSHRAEGKLKFDTREHENLARQRLAAGKASSASMSSGPHDNHQRGGTLAHGNQQRSADVLSETAVNSTTLLRAARHQHQPKADAVTSSASETIVQNKRLEASDDKLRSATSASVINVNQSTAQRQQHGASDNQLEGGHSLGRQANDRRQHRQSSEHSTAGSVSFANLRPADSQRPADRSADARRQPAAKLVRSAQTIAYDHDDVTSKRGVSIIQLVAPAARQIDGKGGAEGPRGEMDLKGFELGERELERVQNGASTIRTRAEPQTDSESVRSNSKDSKGSSKVQLAGRASLATGSLRGRPLMKQQPREHYSPESSLAGSNQWRGRPVENLSSMELDEAEARLLDELASDLDESNADLLTASETTTSNGGARNERLRLASSARYQTQSGPALDFDEEEEEEEGDDDEDDGDGEHEVGAASGEESIEQLHGLGLMRMSHSTHSALTRAGSRDFE